MLASFGAYEAIRSGPDGEGLVSLHSGPYGSETHRVNWELPACASAFRGEPRRGACPDAPRLSAFTERPSPASGGFARPGYGVSEIAGTVRRRVQGAAASAADDHHVRHRGRARP